MGTATHNVWVEAIRANPQSLFLAFGVGFENHHQKKLECNSGHYGIHAQTWADLCRITTQWGCSLLDLDTVQSKVTYSTASGDTRSDTFDLIVGADGANSAVRSAMQRRDPELEVTHIPARRRYKPFYGLKAEGGCPLALAIKYNNQSCVSSSGVSTGKSLLCNGPAPAVCQLHADAPVVVLFVKAKAACHVCR